MLTIVPLMRREVVPFIRQHHRTHRPDQGGRLFFGVEKDGRLVGVCIVGRPRSRQLQRDRFTAEVTRCCTDGTFDAASKLYAQAWIAARAIGYRRLLTYTLPSEGGACLRALRQQGWRRLENEEGVPLLFGGRRVGSGCSTA